LPSSRAKRRAVARRQRVPRPDGCQPEARRAGRRLAIVDPAFKPARPSGPGKTIFLLAGMVLFVTLGLSLAVGLAVIDDRLYRRADSSGSASRCCP